MPIFEIATRGIAYFHVKVRTGERDLHSGIFGGAAMNATHALMQVLGAVLPRDGRLPESLYAGMVSRATRRCELEAARARAGPREPGARAADARAAEELYSAPGPSRRSTCTGSPAVPHLQKTVLPVEAEANVSIRLAPGQDDEAIAAELERLMREAAPEGADSRSSASPARPRRS